MSASSTMEAAVYTLADLKSQDLHIRSCEAFVANQKRIIAARIALGAPTEKDEHWLSVFVSGLARHRRRRAEIASRLSVQVEEAELAVIADQQALSITTPKNLGQAVIAATAARSCFERRRSRAGGPRR